MAYYSSDFDTNEKNQLLIAIGAELFKFGYSLDDFIKSYMDYFNGEIEHNGFYRRFPKLNYKFNTDELSILNRRKNNKETIAYNIRIISFAYNEALKQVNDLEESKKSKPSSQIFSKKSLIFEFEKYLALLGWSLDDYINNPQGFRDILITIPNVNISAFNTIDPNCFTNEKEKQTLDVASKKVARLVNANSKLTEIGKKLAKSDDHKILNKLFGFLLLYYVICHNGEESVSLSFVSNYLNEDDIKTLKVVFPENDCLDKVLCGFYYIYGFNDLYSIGMEKYKKDFSLKKLSDMLFDSNGEFKNLSTEDKNKILYGWKIANFLNRKDKFFMFGKAIADNKYSINSLFGDIIASLIKPRTDTQTSAIILEKYPKITGLLSFNDIQSMFKLHDAFDAIIYGYFSGLRLKQKGTNR